MTPEHFTLNPNFVVKSVESFSNTIQAGFLEYFLAEEIVNYFEVIECYEVLSCATVAG